MRSKIREQQQIGKDPVEFTMKRYFLPPPKIVLTANNGAYLQESAIWSQSTGYLLWKLVLQLKIYFVWTSNSIYALYYFILFSRFSIRTLFCVKFGYKYIYNQEINEVAIDTIKQRSTMCSLFADAISDCRRIIEEYRNSPDTGIFGKSCGLCIIYLRSVWVVFWSFLLYIGLCPIFILLLNALALIVMLMMPFVMVFVVVLFYVFSILIYDEFTPNRNEAYFPLLRNIIFRIIVFGFGQIAYCFVIHPLMIVIWLVYGVIAFVWRTVVDYFMLCIVSCVGREPIYDSILCYQTEGPGARNKKAATYQISELDALLYFVCELQQHEFEYYQKLVYARLEQPYQDSQNFYRDFFQAFISENLHLQDMGEISNRV